MRKKKLVNTELSDFCRLMKIRIGTVPMNADLIDALPELKRIKAFSQYGGSAEGKLDRNKVIRYIILMYSPDSPIVKDYKLRTRSLDERKYIAAQKAGFEPNRDNSMPKTIQDDLFNLQDQQIVKMLAQFLSFVGNDVWRQLVTYEVQARELSELLMLSGKEKSLDDQAKLMKMKLDMRPQLTKIMEDIRSLQETFYSSLHEDDRQKIDEKIEEMVSLESLAEDGLLIF